MSRHGGFLLVCLAVLFHSQASGAWKVPAMTPPAGFSLSVSAKIEEGKQMYTCESGAWVKSGSSALLLAISKSSRIGNFESTHDHLTKRSTMQWTLFNSPADEVESGDATSSVTGMPIHSQSFSSEAVPEALFEVKSHKGAGAAALISYVVMTQTKGGQAPHSSLCTEDDITIGVPFDGVFDFYTQDTQPPANTPASLMPQARVVEGFFVKGQMVYRYDGEKWRDQGIIATLYEVAGGNVIGKFGSMRKPDQFGSVLRWIVNNPNGFWLTGKLHAEPMKVSENGCPWQLLQITSSGGTASPVGPFRFVQLTSTRGGMEPAIPGGAKPGLLWKSPYTGIFWFYS